jgi:hypothetical protein
MGTRANQKRGLWLFLWIFAGCVLAYPQDVRTVRHPKTHEEFPIYPQTLGRNPGFPSPFLAEDGTDIITVIFRGGKFGLAPVTVADRPGQLKQLEVDGEDFPALARDGLHADSELDGLRTITGRTLAEITSLGRPGGLSTSGFMAGDETILSVLKADNRLVRRLRLTHPQLARPLFHIWNLILFDWNLGHWNRDRHTWENAEAVLYNEKRVLAKAERTKGGQRSIFADGITGGATIDIWRDLDAKERKFLEKKYPRLGPGEMADFIRGLSHIVTGEIEPQYIMRYGFYEGHAGWRTDPLAIAFIFGLRSLKEIESAFPGKIPEILASHFLEDVGRTK